MTRVLALAVMAVLSAVPAAAEPVNGDLCFPLEGWALVARWHLGSGARSAREGWLRKEYNDGGWDKRKSGSLIPFSSDGIWLRNSFRGRTRSNPDARAIFSGLPVEAMVFLNGMAVSGASSEAGVPVSAYMRKGANTFAVFYPAGTSGTVQVPSVALTGLGGTGKGKKPAVLQSWRVRAEKVEKEVPDSWLRKPGVEGWKLVAPTVPSSCNGWLPPGPVCLKAVIDVPYYWRNRSVSIFLHDLPGAPSVYLNGRLLEEKAGSPRRFDVMKSLKFDGRDTLCLVYPGLPPCENGRDGRWSMAAIHWEGGVNLPRFPSGTTVFTDFSRGAAQPGTSQSLRYASQLIALSSTEYRIAWSGSPAGGGSMGIVACWSASSFSSSEIAKAEELSLGRVADLGGASKSTIWVVTPPTIGRKHRLPANERLGAANRKFSVRADEQKIRVIPLFEVMRSALRRQRRWPAQAEWSDAEGLLTSHGSYLMALAMLDTFSMP